MGEDITFGQLRTFVCAARLGSFVKAADELGISQPAVSDQIAKLEARLGQVLFQRRRGTTPMLTTSGLAVLHEAETILAAGHNLLAPRPGEGDRERVRISIGPYLRDVYLNPLIGQICRKFPNTDIDLRTSASGREAFEQLKHGQIDLAAYTVSNDGRAYPDAIKLCDVPVAFVVAPSVSERLEAGECALDELDYLIPAKRSGRSVRWVDRLLRGAGIFPGNPPRFLDSAEMVCRMAKEGLGAAYLMPETVRHDIEKGLLKILNLNLQPLSRLIATSAAPQPAVQYIEAQLRRRITMDGSSGGIAVG